MTQIKKMHRMSDGVQVYPQTHTKAVIDDNGYTAESRLQAMQDEINQAQLEVGAVPSDLTPTEGSTNWVTSGGVFNSMEYYRKDVQTITPIYSIINGTYINTDGNVVSGTNFSHTADISLKSGDTISVTVSYVADFLSVLSLHDSSNNTYISVVSPDDSDGTIKRKTYTYKASSDCRVVCSGRTGSGETIDITIISNPLSKVSDLEDSLEDISTTLYGNGICANYTEGKYLHLDTYEEMDNANWAVTEAIPASPFDTIKVVFGTTGIKNYAVAVFYDNEMTPTQSFTSNGYTNEREFICGTSNEAIAYMRASVYLPNINNCTVYVNGKLMWSPTEKLIGIKEKTDILDNIDNIPTENSTNLVLSRGVYDAIEPIVTMDRDFYGEKVGSGFISGKYFYQDTGSIQNNPNWAISSEYYACSPNDIVKVVFGKSTGVANYACMAVYSTSKTWIRCRTTNTYQYERTETVGDEENIGYVRFCFYLPNIENCAAYINNVLVWSYTGRDGSGLTSMVDKLSSKIDSLNDKSEISLLRNSRYSAAGATNGTVGFLHFSDIHGDNGAAQAIRAYYDKYSSYITDMLSTGDIPYYYVADGIDFYIDNKLTDALLALGNHDGCTEDGPNKQGSADWDAMGAQWDYETYYAPYISGWGVTQPTDAATNYLMYYYKDYTSAKVRLIVLDVMHQTAEQLQWFTDTLSDANTNAYTVVVASHYIPNTFVEEDIVKRSDGDLNTFHWIDSKSVTSIVARFRLATTYADAVESFIANGGKFAVWLCGHYHLNFFTYTNTHPNILFCAVDQAGYRRSSGQDYQGYRVVGDHCANMVTIHPALGVIKIHRIGLTTDKYLRPINVLVYDYVNKKVISNY